MSALVAIVGPTASGKSALAMVLARRWQAEVVSVDSMQVYRGMDVGTAKPTPLERNEIFHHMVDIVDPDVEYSVAEFSRAGRRALDSARAPLIITGGSGLHFRALVDPMSFAPTDDGLRHELDSQDLAELVTELEQADRDAGVHVDLQNKRRVVRALEILRLGAGSPSQRAASEEADRLRRYQPDYDFRAFGLDPADRVRQLVAARLSQMRSGGLIDEVRGLSDRMGRTARAAIGYREVLEAMSGRLTIDQAFQQIGANTLKLARRQRTWFQRDPRIRWIPWSEDPGSLADRIEWELE